MKELAVYVAVVVVAGTVGWCVAGFIHWIGRGVWIVAQGLGEWIAERAQKKGGHF